jgi:hypothetical protein
MNGEVNSGEGTGAEGNTFGGMGADGVLGVTAGCVSSGAEFRSSLSGEASGRDTRAASSVVTHWDKVTRP